MIGLMILGALVIYIAIALTITFFITRRLKNKTQKWVAVFILALVFYLIPTWDGILGEWELKRLCEKEGGIRIYKSVEGVEGFQDNFSGGSGAEYSLKKYGYKFIEIVPVPGRLMRYTLDPSGKTKREEVSKSSSNYVVSYSKHYLRFNLIKGEYKIIDKRSNETLSVMNDFYHRGNWLQVKMTPLLGSGNNCSHLTKFNEFYTKTLKPVTFK